MATQAAASGGFANAVVAFAVAAVTLVVALAVFAMVVSTASKGLLADLGVHGPRVKQVGGVLLVAIGLWFIYLAAANPTYLLAWSLAPTLEM